MTEPQITVQAAHVSAGSNLPVNRIVIHSTCPDVGWPLASKPGSASGTAKYFSQASSGGSAHYVEGIDREEHCVADNQIAWHAPPNANSIGVEITSDGGDTGAFRVASHAYTRDQWLSPEVLPILERAAARVAELCDRLGVPKVRINATQVAAGAKGICGHADVSAAFHQSDHTDPGPAFPWDTFMALVTSAPIPEADLPLNDADKAWIASAIATGAVAAATAVWNRFQIHGTTGDVTLQECLSELLQKSPGGATPTKVAGTATVTVNLTPEA
jgi:hypothetical protein